MGAGEACGVAPSSSMISELVPERRRPLALAVFGLASSLGFIVFYPLVGWIGQRYGWRGMFVSSGLPGRTTWMVGFALMSFFALAHQAPISTITAVVPAGFGAVSTVSHAAPPALERLRTVQK